jgi:ABC-type Fe2+-enterobactin transport system substrate-binding protein
LQLPLKPIAPTIAGGATDATNKTLSNAALLRSRPTHIALEQMDILLGHKVNPVTVGDLIDKRQDILVLSRIGGEGRYDLRNLFYGHFPIVQLDYLTSDLVH